MAAGFQVYAPDGSLQLDNTTKIIANTAAFRDFVITSTYDLRWRDSQGGSLNCHTYEYYRVCNYNTDPIYNPDRHLIAFRPAEGRTLAIDNFNSMTGFSNIEEVGANFGKYALIPVEYQPPVANANDNLLVVFDEAGKPVWSLEEFVKSPQVIAFTTITFPSGVKMLNMPPKYFEVPEGINMDKVFVLPLPSVPSVWDQTQTEGMFVSSDVAVTRVGRRFYIMPYEVMAYMGYRMSSVDLSNRNDYVPHTTFNTGVDLLVVYIANAPS